MPKKTLLEYDRVELEQLAADVGRAAGVVKWDPPQYAGVDSVRICIRRDGFVGRERLAKFVEDTEKQAEGYSAQIVALGLGGMKVKLTRKAEGEGGQAPETPEPSQE